VPSYNLASLLEGSAAKYPGRTAIVLGDTRLDYATDGIGEIAIKGHNIFKGYYKRPEATAEVLTADGWFRSGDLAKRDADGWYYIVDRAKEAFIVSRGDVVASAQALVQQARDHLASFNTGRLITVGHWRPGDPEILIAMDSRYNVTRLAYSRNREQSRSSPRCPRTQLTRS